MSPFGYQLLCYLKTSPFLCMAKEEMERVLCLEVFLPAYLRAYAKPKAWCMDIGAMIKEVINYL
jgi:hypothetical protein